MTGSLAALAVLLADEGAPTFEQVRAVNLRLLDSVVTERRAADTAAVAWPEWVVSDGHAELKRHFADLLARWRANGCRAAA